MYYLFGIWTPKFPDNHFLLFSLPFLFLPWNLRGLGKHFPLWSVSNLCPKIDKLYSGVWLPAPSFALTSNLSLKEVNIQKESQICQVVWLYHLQIISSQGNKLNTREDLAHVSSVFIFISLHTYSKRKLFTYALPWFLLPWQPRSCIAKKREREREKGRERERKIREWDYWLTTRLRRNAHRPLEQYFR